MHQELLTLLRAIHAKPPLSDTLLQSHPSPTAFLTGMPPFPPITPRIAHLRQKSILELSGPDAPKFLKGLSCKDVEPIGGGYSGFLNASGRVLHTAFIFPGPNSSYLITHESPADHPAPLNTLLPPFRLRSKVRIRDVTEQWDAWSAWGDSLEDTLRPTRTWKIGSGGAAESHWSWDGGVRDVGTSKDERGCWDLRAGWYNMGRQLVVPKGTKPTLASSHDQASAEDYRIHRTLLGVPEGPAEILPGSALPLESCMDIHGGVDFRKGCYLGQELTVRTYHTGATRKRILPIRLFSLEGVAPLAELISSSESLSEAGSDLLDITYYPPASSATQKPRSAGRVLSLHNSMGLALVRLEMVERCWWSGADVLALSAKDWLAGGTGKMVARMNGQEWGVSSKKVLSVSVGGLLKLHIPLCDFLDFAFSGSSSDDSTSSSTSISSSSLSSKRFWMSPFPLPIYLDPFNRILLYNAKVGYGLFN
ncbi:hypothetical protein IAT38_004756 [Cryptococcus sp. DSM 104549]